MSIHRIAIVFVISLILIPYAQAVQFKVGFAKRDVTPTKPMPMWGYGARHDAMSVGVRDPLHAKAVVIDVGEQKLALVGLDLGRSPSPEVMARIRAAVKEVSNVNLLMISGSHTHSGPVIELRDEEGKGKGKYDDAVAYARDLEKHLIDAINEAAANVQDARIGWGSAQVPMNRNRHTKKEAKPTDSELTVLRFDGIDGKPIALMVNFAAHPTILPGEELKFSAEWPGQMMAAAEAALGSNVGFLQGAAGDMSPNTTDATRSIEAFGKALGEKVVAIAQGIETHVPQSPEIQGMDEDFDFTTRMPVDNPMVADLLAKAFFPEFGKAAFEEMAGNKITPHLTTILLNKELALVGGSGEFFCNHSNRLKERAKDVKVVFVGYCNGHHMYFPTIEAAAEGGYGADPTVSWVPLGAGEEMMNKALINIYTMLGKYTFNLSAEN